MECLRVHHIFGKIAVGVYVEVLWVPAAGTAHKHLPVTEHPRVQVRSDVFYCLSLGLITGETESRFYHVLLTTKLVVRNIDYGSEHVHFTVVYVPFESHLSVKTYIVFNQ